MVHDEVERGFHMAVLQHDFREPFGEEGRAGRAQNPFGNGDSREEVRRNGRGEDARLVEEQIAVAAGDEGNLVEAGLQSGARLGGVAGGKHAREVQQGGGAHVRCRVAGLIEQAGQQFVRHRGSVA